MPNINYITRKDIDIEKWDACIDNAPNGLAYAYSFYLDAMCDNWDALVLDDYAAVMPLPWRRKWGIRYVYTPFFVPTLGIFYKKGQAQYNIAFLYKINRHFNYCHLDADSPPEQFLPKPWQQSARTNMVIPPGEATYSRLAKRKLATAMTSKLEIEINVPPEKIIRAYQQEYSAAHAEIPAKSYTQLIAACAKAPAINVHTLVAHLPHERFAGFYLLLSDKNNYYSLLGGCTAEGKKTGAFYLLTHASIQKASQQQKTFRFEGSDIPGIAFFNQQFGPRQHEYAHWHFNNLPWLIRWFKK